MGSTLLGSIDHRLPNELALSVVQSLAHDKRVLCALAQTCRGFQQLAEEHVYKRIKLRSVRDLERITAAFVARSERVRAVHTLEILYRWADNLEVSLSRRQAFNECVVQMVNLREWHIESPYDNFKWDKGGHEWVEGDMERFRQGLEKACVDGAQEKERFAQNRTLYKSLQRTVGLAQLESLTIHSHGAHADFWELDGFHCLFRHPSLRHLHVSCVTFPPTLGVLEAHQKTTPLTTLILDECNVETKSLRQILSTPEKLKHLTIGENVFNIHRSVDLSPKLSPQPVEALEAIGAVAHSLETLVHLDSNWRVKPEKQHIVRQRVCGDGMRQFDALKSVECDTGSFLHEAIVMNRELCPPNLDTLIVRRHFYVAENFFDYLPDVGIYTALPSIKTLELRQSGTLLNKISRAEYICEGERVRKRHAYGYALWKRGINFRVSIELGRGLSLIPPYLHGEPVPEVGYLYDGSVVGFQRSGVETEQLDEVEVAGMANETGRVLERMRERFTRGVGSTREVDSDGDGEDDDYDEPLSELEDGNGDDGEDDDYDEPLSELEDDNGDDGEDGDYDEPLSELEDELEGSESRDSEFEGLIADLQNNGDEETFLHFIQHMQVLEHMQDQGIEIDMGSDGGEWEDAGDGLDG